MSETTDWLEAPGCDIIFGEESVTVTCSRSAARIKIAGTPHRQTLVVRSAHDVTLDVDPTVYLNGDFGLVLEAEDHGQPVFSLNSHIHRISCHCEGRPSSGTRPVLALSGPAAVRVASGPWHITSTPTGTGTPVDVEVDNVTEEVRIDGGIPIRRLKSRGNHTYSAPFVRGASVEIVEGTATFVDSLVSCHVSGQGSLIVEGDLVDSEVTLTVEDESATEPSSAAAIEITGNARNCEFDSRVDITIHGSLTHASGPSGREESQDNAERKRLKQVKCRNLAVDGDIRGGRDIDATSLTCRGACAAGHIDVYEGVVAHGPLKCDSLTFRGITELHGSLFGIAQVYWFAARSSSELRLRPQAGVESAADRTLRRLEVRHARQSKPIPKVVYEPGVSIADMVVDVPELEMTLDAGAAAATGSQPADVEGAADLSIRLRQAFKVNHRDLSVAFGGGIVHCELASRVEGELTLQVPDEVSAVLTSVSHELGQLRVVGDGRVVVEPPSGPLTIERLTIRGTASVRTGAMIKTADIDAAPTDRDSSVDPPDRTVPRLDLDSSALVLGLTGRCHLANLGARVYGDGVSPFKLVGIDSIDESGEPPRGGHLIDVDINELPPTDISRLGELEVLEISGNSLKRHAAERTVPRQLMRLLLRSTDVPDALRRDEIRQRAESIAEISRFVEGRVNSGNSRTWIQWSIARLQHRGLGPLSIERVFRALYRLVGYGCRPGVAFVSWLVAAAFATLLLSMPELAAADPVILDAEVGVANQAEAVAEAEEIGVGTFDIDVWSLHTLEDFIELALSPITRLGFGAGPAHAVFQSSALDIGMRVLIGIPFLFFLLGVRQFFRAPKRTAPLATD